MARPVESTLADAGEYMMDPVAMLGVMPNIARRRRQHRGSFFAQRRLSARQKWTRLPAREPTKCCGIRTGDLVTSLENA